MRNLLIGLLAFFIILLVAPVYAGGVDVDVNNSASAYPSSSSNTGSTKAWGFSHGMGDVDIAGCLGSEQWSTIIVGKQKLVINWPCMAEFYLKAGKPELAAMALCNTEILDEFESEAECEAAHEGLMVFAPTPEATADDDDEDFHDEFREEQQQLYADIVAKIENLEAAKRPKVTKQVVQQPYLTDKQRAALRELK